MQQSGEIGSGLCLVAATPADAPRLTALQRAAYAPWLPVIGLAPLPYRQDYAALLADHDAWFAVTEDGTEAGALILKAETDHLLIWSIAIAAALSGRGLGRALMAFAEDEARRRRLPEIRLYTHVLMARNIALYQRLGYVETGREDTPDGRRIVHMAKRIGG